MKNYNFQLNREETYTPLLEPLVSHGQDENIPSDGEEQFMFSDTSVENAKGDDPPSIPIDEFSESSEGLLSDYDSETAEDCNGIEELDDDNIGSSMGKQADKLQGSYFKLATIKRGDKIKEVVKFALNQVFDNVDHFKSTLKRKLCRAKEKGISLASGELHLELCIDTKEDVDFAKSCHNRLTDPPISNEERVRKKETRKARSKSAPFSSTHD